MNFFVKKKLNSYLSGSILSAHTKQDQFIHSMSGKGRKPVKKILAYAAGLLTMRVEVQSPYNRIIISYNREGHSAFAVFLLSFSMVREIVFGVGFALLFPQFYGLDGVLYSMLVSDILTFFISASVIASTYRQLNGKSRQQSKTERSEKKRKREIGIS